MDVRSDRCYSFPASRAAVWAGMGAVDEFRTWWPWLRRFEADGLVAGDRWRCTVQPPLPYVVRFTVHLDEVVEPSFVGATVEGDVAGWAELELTDAADGCEVRLTSALAPRGGLLRVFASAAGPLVRFGHDWVLDNGARRFSATLVPT